MAELLRDHTTLRLGGPARDWVEATTEREVVDAVARGWTRQGEPVLVLAGGSNLVVADEGFEGTVVKLATRGVAADSDDPDDLACSGAVTVTVAAGESWDALVAEAVDAAGSASRRCPGSPGRSGRRRSRTSVPTARRSPRRSPGPHLGPGARPAAHLRGRRLRLRLPHQPVQGGARPLRRTRRDVPAQQGTPRRPGAVRRAGGPRSGVERGAGAAGRRPRGRAELRSGKGMVLDPEDHDTWSAGSFFTNPVVAAGRVPEGAPAWPHRTAGSRPARPG